MIISSFLYVPGNGIISFFYMAEPYTIVYMYHFFLIRSSVHFVCLHIFCISARMGPYVFSNSGIFYI